MGVSYGRSTDWFECPACDGIDASEWLEGPAKLRAASDGRPCSGSSRQHRMVDSLPHVPLNKDGEERLEELIRELFWFHDLNGDGVLQEDELIRLNQKIAVMHHGVDINVSEANDSPQKQHRRPTEVGAKFRDLFRAKLDPNGDPVEYETFRAYTRDVIYNLDSDPEAQEMIMEQFVVEAQTGRQALVFESLWKEPDFRLKESDIPRVLQRVVAELDRRWEPVCPSRQLQESFQTLVTGPDNNPLEEVGTERHCPSRPAGRALSASLSLRRTSAASARVAERSS